MSVYQTGYEMAKSVEKLTSLLMPASGLDESILERIWFTLPIHSPQELSVKGDDLLQWTGLEAGPWIGEWLSKIEYEIITNTLKNDKTAIRKWVNQCLQQKRKS